MKPASNVVPMIDYQKGILGTITGIGTAPYRDRDGASSTPYVALELADDRARVSGPQLDVAGEVG